MRMTRALYCWRRRRRACARAERAAGAAAGADRHRRGRHRQRRHRRRGHRPERPGSRRLGDRGNHATCPPATPRWSSPTTRAATSCPTCRRPSTRSGCAATASSTSPKVDARARPAAQSHARWRRRTKPAAAKYYPAIYWYSMLKIPPKSEFGGSTDIPAKVKQDRLAERHEEQRLRRLPPARPAVDAHDPGRRSASFVLGEAWVRRVSVRPVRRADGQPAGRPARRRAVQVFRRLDRSHRQGRAAARPSRRGRKASSATSSSRPGTGDREAATCTT